MNDAGDAGNGTNNAGDGTNNDGAGNGDGKNLNKASDNTNGGQGDGSGDALTDAQIELALKDERTWKHPRVSEGLKAISKLKKIGEQKDIDETKRLEEEKKWEELAAKNADKAEKAEARAKETLLVAEIKTKALQLGIVDLDVATQFVNRENIKIDDNGVVSGVDEALKVLTESKPYLLSAEGGDKKKPIGSSTSPSGDQKQQRKFKHSEIADPVFFAKHESEIMEAMKLNLIEDDIQQ